jgi:fructose-bisphosphate aldolase, class I
MNRVKEILSYYTADCPGTIGKLEWMMNTGKLAGTGRMIILPVDQGYEHGPARSFAPNPAGYDPEYHAQLAIDAGFSAYAAPLGFIEAIARDYCGKIPLILKLNSHEVCTDEDDPVPAMTASVDDALRLGCAAVGYTVYPGNAFRVDMYEQLREIAEEAKSVGLVVIVWSYPRGTGLSKEGETAVDIGAYAAQIACQMGAHIIKVKLPGKHIEGEAAKKVFEKEKIPIDTAADRVRHVVQSAFNGKRIVIFSGGAKVESGKLLDEIRAIKDGGGFGSIVGRNSFQRPKADAIKLIQEMVDIYKS